MPFSLLPRTILETKSPISGEIKIVEQLGKYRLHVGEMLQSGGILEGIWRRALRQVSTPSSTRGAQGKLSVSNCLVLGLGGGTVVQLIKARYPEAKIVSVEIDPEIIKISKKFFGLSKIENLKIVNADAIKWVANYDISYHRSRFDLILVDLYIGRQLSPKVESNEFLKNLKKLLSKDGMVVFNQLKNKDGGKLKQSLTTTFPQVEALDLKTNLFLICRP